MKKTVTIIPLILVCLMHKLNAQQNLILNPSFEDKICFDSTNFQGLYFWPRFVVTNPPLSDGDCVVSSWIPFCSTPDAYSLLAPSTGAYYIPINAMNKYLYPHSGKNCAAFSPYDPYSGSNVSEIIEGKLRKSLVHNHTYVMSFWVQLQDTPCPSGLYNKVVASNSFDVYFSDTAIYSYQSMNTFPVNKFTPQVEINKMITDTQNWVQLIDTFQYEGLSANYFCLGNFKKYSQIQTQVIDSIGQGNPISYYFLDDVSLIDLDTSSGVGMNEVMEEENKLLVYPNPASQSLVISSQSLVNTVEVYDVIGRVVNSKSKIENQKETRIDVSGFAKGVYFIKATDANGNVMNGRFVKE